MDVWILPNNDVSYLDKVLIGKDGYLNAVPYSDITNIIPEHLQLWCVKNAVYQIITKELIEFLKEKINGNVIEIGSGNGSLALHLGIPD